MSGHGIAQELALAAESTLRRQAHAERLARAVRFYRDNSDLGFEAVAKLFRVGSNSLKQAVRGQP